MFPVEIAEHPARRLFALSHHGAYIEIGATFEKLTAMAQARNLFPHMRGMIGIYYHDPDSVPEADLRSHAAMEIEGDVPLPDGLEEVHLPGGKVAVMHYKGPYSGLHAAYKYLYGPWLAEEKVELRDAAPFEMYLNAPHDTAPEDLRTDVCVPVA